MKRFALLFLIACQPSQASKPAVVERNFVCERVALKDPTASCVPEYSGEGPNLVHTARITQGGETVSCGVTVGQLGAVCSGLFVQAQEQKPVGPVKQ